MNTVSEQSFEKALDRIRELSRSNTELLEALKYIALNHNEDGWGVFPPDAYQQATEAIRRASR